MFTGFRASQEYDVFISHSREADTMRTVDTLMLRLKASACLWTEIIFVLGTDGDLRVPLSSKSAMPLFVCSLKNT